VKALWKDKARPAIYTMAGIYLLTLAYEMFQQLSDAGSEKIIMIVFMVFFVIAGIGIAAFGIRSMWKNNKK
jgi:hypothetical protein